MRISVIIASILLVIQYVVFLSDFFTTPKEKRAYILNRKLFWMAMVPYVPYIMWSSWIVKSVVSKYKELPKE